MSAWRDIPQDGTIPHDDCVLVRRKRDGRWGVSIAYMSKGNGWRAENGALGIGHYDQWAPIPD